MIGDQGTGTFVLAVGVRFPATFSGQYVTATATGASGNTSEFSACTGYVDDTIFVAGFDDGSS